MRYEPRLLENGWAVWDTAVGSPTSVTGRWQTAMTMPEARDVSRRLNLLTGTEPDCDATIPPPEDDPGGGDICSLEIEPSTEGDKPLD